MPQRNSCCHRRGHEQLTGVAMACFISHNGMQQQYWVVYVQAHRGIVATIQVFSVSANNLQVTEACLTSTC